jgi:hypothetical protein
MAISLTFRGERPPNASEKEGNEKERLESWAG